MSYSLTLIFARAAEAASTSEGKGESLEWAIVLGGVIIGLAITLMPPKRTSEVKKAKEK